MPNSSIHVKIEGLDKITKALGRFPREIARYMSAAGTEAGKDLINLEGLKKYPPAGPWNAPPVPYYIRGRGTQTKSGNRGNSQRLGTKWTVERESYGASIGNSASYARFLHSEQQVSWAESHGWRKLYSSAKEKIGDITKVFQSWTDKLIHDLGL